jgi:pimeloyl-ACP methyl ester carboxylesterase
MRGYGEMIYEDLSVPLGEAAPQTPVLIVAGAHDLPPMRPEALKAGAAALVPNGRVVAIAGAGHYPMIETPPRLAQIIQAHLAEPVQ